MSSEGKKCETVETAALYIFSGLVFDLAMDAKASGDLGSYQTAVFIHDQFNAMLHKQRDKYVEGMYDAPYPTFNDPAAHLKRLTPKLLKCVHDARLDKPCIECSHYFVYGNARQATDAPAETTNAR